MNYITLHQVILVQSTGKELFVAKPRADDQHLEAAPNNQNSKLLVRLITNFYLASTEFFQRSTQKNFERDWNTMTKYFLLLVMQEKGRSGGVNRNHVKLASLSIN